jgi:hypothetical protein
MAPSVQPVRTERMVKATCSSFRFEPNLSSVAQAAGRGCCGLRIATALVNRVGSVNTLVACVISSVRRPRSS